MTKITKQERELFIQKRMTSINDDKAHALQLFEAHFKCEPGDMPEDKYSEWLGMNDKQKRKILNKIIEIEDKAFAAQAFSTHKLNTRAALRELGRLKHEQLVKLGVRQE